MALELAEYGITVNAVAPGEIAGPMTGQEDTGPYTEDRSGDAREVAAVIAFLAGPDASYVTGASWSVDGGMLRRAPRPAPTWTTTTGAGHEPGRTT
jgi:NAD(P)-dependent dehydrogenase (short-subunit alcohol dehydrogenase family)